MLKGPVSHVQGSHDSQAGACVRAIRIPQQKIACAYSLVYPQILISPTCKSFGFVGEVRDEVRRWVNVV